MTKLIADHVQFAEAVSRRYCRNLPRHADHDDVVQAGMLGLIDAAKRWRPDSGILFKTFAAYRIIGSIKDMLRELDNLSRAERKANRAAAEKGDDLPHNEPNFIPLDSTLVPGKGGWGGSDGSLIYEVIADIDAVDPEDSALVDERVEILYEALARLPERERFVITMYYLEDLKEREIAEILGVTLSRVSQLLARARLRLRSTMRHHIDLT